MRRLLSVIGDTRFLLSMLGILGAYRVLTLTSPSLGEMFAPVEQVAECSLPDPIYCVAVTPTPSAQPPVTAQPTVTPRPTSTPVITPTAASSENLFENPSFESSRADYLFVEVLQPTGWRHAVAEGWQADYCDGCPALRRGAGNPPYLVMGRPEYKSAYPDQFRIRDGNTAQQWFCFYRVCDGGVYQTVNTVPGQTCQVRAYVQSWSDTDPGTGDPHRSKLDTGSDKENSVWYIRVDPSGGNDMFRFGLLTSRPFGYNDGIYDQFAEISFIFMATGPRTTVFFENSRLWPFRNNDNYLDDAEIRCN